MRLLTLVVLFASSAFASENRHLVLEYHYSRYGVEVCHGKLHVEPGEQYLACEAQSRGNRVHLILGTELYDQDQFKISADAQEIGADNKIVSVSRPMVMVMSGMPSSISQGDGKTVDLNLSVEAHWE